MKRLLFIIVLLLLPAALFAQAEHSVWSSKPQLVKDGQTNASHSTFVKGNAVFAWTEGSTTAYIRAVVLVNANLTYEFRFITSTTLSTADEISGKFDVFRNGTNVCHFCVGKAYLLSQPAGAGKSFKIYIGTGSNYAEKWHFSGTITNRFDF